ncbi:MAG: PEP-CTERM sorting domain-containing protein [Pirellulales bacterium]|nr:PEP-CTERM sorting domain-containing protein [Pirellulales bacterium]
MRNRITTLWLSAGIALAVGCLAIGPAFGGFVLVEDFEDLNLGSIKNQDGWYASSPTSQVVTMPGEGDNQSLQVVAEPATLHRSAVIPQGETRMLFLRFRFEGQHNYSFGMSHLASPVEFSDFGPELRKRAALNRFDVHDGNNYTELTELEQATWYNLWVLVNNDADNAQIWLHDRPGEAALPSDQLDAEGQTAFGFRTGGLSDLINFYIKAADGGSGNDPLWIDDIHLETTGAVNLANPVPEPGTWVVLSSALAALVAIRARRRRA